MQKLINTLITLALFSCSSNSSYQVAKEKTQKQNNIQVDQAINTSKVDTNLSFERYCNSRYGYCIDYPKGVFYPQPESYNGDGRVFKNKKGKEVLRVFGRNNSDPDFGNISIEQQYNDDIHGADEENGNNDRVITYQKLGKRFFVISGYNKGKIFYQKTIIKDDAFAYAIIQYDESEKEIFAKVADRIFKSFK